MNSDFNDPAEIPSKTRRKKDAHEQQRLGERLANLQESKLGQLQLPEKLRLAIAEYQRLPKSFGARKRQLQFIGKLMRNVDTVAIESSLASLESGPGPSAQRKQEISELVDTILAGGGDTIEELLIDNPHLERQALRQFLLEYQRASEDKRDVIKSRLHKYLGSLLQD